MAVPGTRLRKNLSHDRELVPLSPSERAIIEKISAYPIARVAVDQLRPGAGHARVHSDSKITALSGAIRRFGFVEPIIVDKDYTIISGMARWIACKAMGVAEVPVIAISHLSAIEVRALRIALGRFPEWATWDRDQLCIELPEIIVELPDLSMEEMGFTIQEFDRLVAPSVEQDGDPADAIPEIDDTAPPISRAGDLWQLGQHLVFCGDALEVDSYNRLVGNTAVRMVLTDPPYNLKINGNVTKRIGKFAEFAIASGELSNDQFRDFLRKAFGQIARVCVAGAMGFFFIDWRHARILEEAADGLFFELKNHIVWVKDAPGLGSFYRSRHEFVLAYKIADGKHVNNFELGQHGRLRTNVWEYAGMSSFGAGRDEALELHVTPKPVAMLVDAIFDCSSPGDLVLDPFGGSGSTLIAAERTHRRARLIEISPIYVDTIVRRWERFSGEQAMLADTDQSFAVVAEQRRQAHDEATDRSERQDTGKDEEPTNE